MGAFGFVSKASTKFFHEVAPVALASVIGTVLVNHYSHSRTPASIVVQQPASPPDAILQVLHDEHQLIVDYLKRDAEAKQAISDEESLSRAAPAAPAAKDGPAKSHVALGEKPTPPPRPKAEKSPQDPLPLGPNLAAMPAPEPPAAPAGLIAQGSNMADAIGGFVAAAWRYPGQALPRPSIDLSVATWPFAWADSAFRSHADPAAPR